MTLNKHAKDSAELARLAITLENKHECYNQIYLSWASINAGENATSQYNGGSK